VTVELPGGRTIGCHEAQAVGHIRIANYRWLLRALLDRDLAVGDAYVDGSIAIDGDIIAVLETAHRSLPRWSVTRSRLREAGDSLPRRISGASAHQNAAYHYETDAEFYRLWLDPSMTYTCAYFEDDAMDLAHAQTAKLDYVCRKLLLTPGERVVDAGSGWGALAIHMATHYDVTVDCFNISHRQNEIAAERAAQAGVADKIRFVDADYRSIEDSYDVFISIGMLEHVGLRHYRKLGAIARRAIGSNGRGLIHTIGRDFPMPTNGWIARRIFPGGYAPALSETMQIFEPNGLSVLDVENLRPHYARTLECWLANLHRERGVIEERYGAAFFRRWELYLASACAGFRTGWLELYQLVFSAAESNAVSLVRPASTGSAAESLRRPQCRTRAYLPSRRNTEDLSPSERGTDEFLDA